MEPLIRIDTTAVRTPHPVAACRWRFPDPRRANPVGLVARGGDFEPSTLIHAYRSGIFPWPHGDEDYLWFSPDPRAVLVPGALHVSRRLRRVLRQGRFTASIDRAFLNVMEGCAGREEGTWISARYQEAYGRLHELGWAHSLEVWTQDGALGGGLYGLAIGGFFAAESMFHLVDDASKAAMVALMLHLEQRGFVLVDVQMPTPHLERMGAVTISRNDYLALLGEALAAEVTF
jgi:leucyl/phenylalanyl-tRNA---protein transferase